LPSIQWHIRSYTVRREHGLSLAVAWHNATPLAPKQYVCGFCGSNVASALGFLNQNGPHIGVAYVCPMCDKPTFFSQAIRVPGAPLGNSVQHVPDDVNKLYEEARSCCASSAYTAAVLLCRKLLMNIAVAEGAAAGQSFMQYVEYLAAQGYVPPKGKVWVDHIRKKGNEATHEIQIMKEQDALDLISFSEMLLKFIFEFPKKVPAPKS
jgi:uncharacterized protein DUF4145